MAIELIRVTNQNLHAHLNQSDGVGDGGGGGDWCVHVCVQRTSRTSFNSIKFLTRLRSAAN